MCKPGGGNNRCPIHQRGSIATLNTTTQLTGTPRDEATIVFKELAAEGSNLQPPTQEMVLSFAETQRLHAKYNPTLTHAAREKITNQWEQAKEETPSGGTFHAWKNTLSEVVRRQRSNIRVIGASLALSAVITGCGGNIKEPTPTPSPTETQTVAPFEVEAIDYTKNEQFGIVPGADRTDAYGDYQQSTLADDSPLLQYDESKVAPGTLDMFNEDEVKSAQSVVSPYAVAQTDSTLLWDDSDDAKTAWLEENKSLYAEEWHGVLEENVMDPQQNGYLVTNGNARGWKTKMGGGTEPVYVDGQPRLAFEKAELVSVSSFTSENGVENLRFDYEFVTHEDSVQPNQEDPTGVIINREKRSYAVERDGSGGWVLSGWAEESRRESVAEKDYDPSAEYATHELSEPGESTDAS